MELNEIEQKMIEELKNLGFKYRTQPSDYGIGNTTETVLAYKQFEFWGVSIEKRWFKSILCVCLKAKELNGGIDYGEIAERALKQTEQHSNKIWYKSHRIFTRATTYWIYIPIECVQNTVKFIDLYYQHMEETRSKQRKKFELQKEQYRKKMETIYNKQINKRC